MLNFTYNKKVYPNGLTLLTVPLPDAPSVTVSLFFKVGSRYEQAKINGLSHFIEHLHFKGSKKYPTAKKLSEVIDSIGAEFNANTGKEHTQYYIRADQKHLQFVFEVLSGMLINPLFDEKEIEREKGVIIEEINMYKDLPQAHVESVFETNMWPNQPLGRDIAGTAKVIKLISRNDVLNYRKRFYHPSNLLIAVSGNFNQTQLEKSVDKFWIKLPRKKISAFVKAKERQHDYRLAVEYKKTEQAHIILGFPAFPMGSKKNIPLKVLSVVLGGGMSSRLFIKIREREGLAYYIGASGTTYLDAGAFVISAGLKIDSTVRAVGLILQELKETKKNGITRAELKKAKEYLKGKMALALEDTHEKLDWYLGQAAFLKKIKTPGESIKEIEAVTVSDVQKIAKNIMRRKNLVLAAVGPFKNKKEFVEEINKF
jgi:predicted Zn-dependent peptidase